MTTKLRKIPLRTTSIKVRQQDGTTKDMPFDYREHLTGALNQPPTDERSGQPRGFGPVEMKRRLEIIKIIDDAKDEILLDNAQWNELNKCVKDQRWMIADQAIVDFSEAIEKAVEVEIEEKKDQNEKKK